MGKFQDIASKVGAVVDSKNRQYGDSFSLSGDFLKLLYPNGIPVEAYTDALCVVRIFDKLKRLANIGNLSESEGKLDAWSDIIGYAILGLAKDDDENNTVVHGDFKFKKAALVDIITETKEEKESLPPDRKFTAIGGLPNDPRIISELKTMFQGMLTKEQEEFIRFHGLVEDSKKTE